ncbi:hypothetical protein DPX16_10250 [Anabarilius grahami]|uniref:Uncharacterized protein n=1 Tax=Anabarilius grahami TaxID=495550 RepID=A0A3N0Y0N6_ANAGA|nr:hypothetical protein DPX16_10250 [Anabarilius grahami]
MPEPAADAEPKPAVLPAAETKTEPIIALEPEPDEESDQVQEPATSSVPVGVLVKYKGMKWRPGHISKTEGELHMASGNYYKEVEKDIPLSVPSPLVMPSSKSPVSPLVPPSSKSPASTEIPPSLALPSPLPITASLSCFPSAPRLLL